MLAFRFPLGSMASVDGGGACTGSEKKAEEVADEDEAWLEN